jgi:hypothetical protein
MDETWLYHYDPKPETKQQSLDWRHSGSPRPGPKKFLVQKSTEKVLASIFWDQNGIRYPLHWLSSKGPNYQRGVSLISAGAIEGLCEGKTLRAGRSSSGSCSCTTMPRLTGHLQHRRNRITRAPNVLISHPIFRNWLRWTTTLNWTNNWKVAIFCPTRRSLLPRRPGWTDNHLNFLWVAFKI